MGIDIWVWRVDDTCCRRRRHRRPDGRPGQRTRPVLHAAAWLSTRVDVRRAGTPVRRLPISAAPTPVDVCVIGGGQAALATGYFLHRRHRDAARYLDPPPSFVLLDNRDGPGGAWRDAWESLRLFSPAAYSSLPGWRMPLWAGDGNPPAGHVRAYLAEYERRYDLPVERPARVREVACTRSLDEDPRPADDRLLVRTDANIYAARVVINATGTWSQPHW